jgi:leucyl/phenylalanyl-tRNA--protein transferase
VETWIDGNLVGGLYCVALGKSVFGESMFSRASEASKIALAALVCFCRHHGIKQIDCQQNTPHLASLGASEVSRAAFIEQMTAAQTGSPTEWKFDTLYWNKLFHPDSPAT